MSEVMALAEEVPLDTSLFELLWKSHARVAIPDTLVCAPALSNRRHRLACA